MSKGTMDRIAAIWRSNVNEVLDHLEDPEKIVPQMVRDMEASVDQAVASLSKAVANQKRLEKEHARNVDKIAECQEKAEVAVEKGDEEYARLVLAQKAQLGQTNAALEPLLEESREVVVQLRPQLEELRTRLGEAKERQDALISRVRSERRQQAADKGVGIGTESEAYVRFAEIEQRVRDHEKDFARFEEQAMVADAEAELLREMAEGERTERELKRMEAEHRVEEELAKLREKNKKEA